VRRFVSALAVAIALGSAAATASVDATPAPPRGAALRGIAEPPAKPPLAQQRIYFVMTDRYANGSTSNDTGGVAGPPSVTGFLPDDTGYFHGGDLAGLTGAPVLQGRDDYAQCVRTWGEQRDEELMPAYLRLHGTPEPQVEGFRDEAAAFVRLVRFVRDPEPLEVGDRLEGWEVHHFPGHADGHRALLRDGILVAGDTLLGSITPNVGLYPASRPDPLADYLGSLERIIELEPRLALPGHGDPIADPAGRAHELIAHHDARLDQTAAAERPPQRRRSRTASSTYR